MSAFIDTLKNIDTSILLFINGMHSPFWDSAMTVISGRFTWIPLYVLLVYVIIRNYGKTSWLIIVCVVLAVVLSDQIASHLLKNLVMRNRPSHDVVLMFHLHFVDNYTGGQYGFASSHAANTFAIACFMALLMPQKRIMVIGLFLWAALVCYSRMYLGVHYPSDIIGGAFIGFVCAWLAFQIWKIANRRLLTPPS